MKYLNQFSIVIIVLIAFACENIEEIVNSPSMISFCDETELSAELLTVSNMTDDEKVNWQNENLFVSHEIQAQSVYSQLNFEIAKNMDDILKICNENKEHIICVEDEDGEFYVETKYYNNPYKYFANQEGLFKVGEQIYRVYNEGTIATLAANKDELLNLSFDEAKRLEKFKDVSLKPISFLKSAQTTQCNDFPLRCTSGRERVKLSCFPSNLHNDFLAMNVKVWGYRRYVAWINVSRDLSFDIEVEVLYRDRSNILQYHTFSFADNEDDTKELYRWTFIDKTVMDWYYSPTEVMAINSYTVTSSQENVTMPTRSCISN